jgi:hypothetical protein
MTASALGVPILLLLTASDQSVQPYFEFCLTSRKWEPFVESARWIVLFLDVL